MIYFYWRTFVDKMAWVLKRSKRQMYGPIRVERKKMQLDIFSKRKCYNRNAKYALRETN